MIFPHHQEQEDGPADEPFIVPIAVPLTAGPAAIATVMLFASQDPTHLLSWSFAIVIATFFFLVVVLASPYLMKILGDRGLIAVERLMGMILTVVAVQMLLTGVSQYLKLVN